MAELGYDPSAQASQAKRHGPVADRYRTIEEDPELAKRAGGSRGAVIIPAATAAGGSSGRAFRRRVMTVHLEPDAAGRPRTVEVDLDKITPAQMAAVAAKASSAANVWEQIANEQAEIAARPPVTKVAERVSMSVPTLPQQSAASPAWAAPPQPRPAALPTLPPLSQPQWSPEPAQQPYAPQPAQQAWQPPPQPMPQPLPPQRDPLLEQLVGQVSQLGTAVQYLLERAQTPVEVPAPQPQPVAAPVQSPPTPPVGPAVATGPVDENPLAVVGLEYLGYPNPKEPSFQVIFNWGPAGLQAGYYHAVKVVDQIVALEFDTRSKTSQYVPGVRNEPIDIVIINQLDRTNRSLRVTPTGIVFRVGCLDICLLVVEDKATEDTPAGDPFHRPVSVQQMINGELPDVLPEADYGKTREYRP